MRETGAERLLTRPTGLRLPEADALSGTVAEPAAEQKEQKKSAKRAGALGLLARQVTGATGVTRLMICFPMRCTPFCGEMWE
jgi:hypothetical protein